MVMYPHTLTVTLVGVSVIDSNGDYTDPETQTEVVKCRAESASSDGYITSGDGTKIDFSWIVYMPLSSPAIPIGATVQIEASGVTINDTVKRYSKGQMNARLWL